MIQFRIGDGSTGIHWRQEDNRFFIDMRLTPRKHEIGADASGETSDPDLMIEFSNPKSVGVMIWALSEILQRMPDHSDEAMMYRIAIRERDPLGFIEEWKRSKG